MYRLINIIFLLSISTLNAISQNISNSEFEWKWINDCRVITQGKCVEIWNGRLYGPFIPDLDSVQFAEYLAKDIDEMDLSGSGWFKIRIQFYVDKGVCVQRIGMKDVNCNPDQLNRLKECLQILSSFTPAETHRNRKVVNSKAWLYICIKDGKLASYKNKLFYFNGQDPPHSSLLLRKP